MTISQRNSIASAVSRLRRSLKTLDRSLRRLTPMLSAAAFLNDSPKANGRSRPHLSAKARASLVLQGRYMGYMRQLKPRQKALVRRLRQRKGIQPAITQAARLAQGLRPHVPEKG